MKIFIIIIGLLALQSCITFNSTESTNVLPERKIQYERILRSEYKKVHLIGFGGPRKNKTFEEHKRIMLINNQLDSNQAIINYTFDKQRTIYMGLFVREKSILTADLIRFVPKDTTQLFAKSYWCDLRGIDPKKLGDSVTPNLNIGDMCGKFELKNSQYVNCQIIALVDNDYIKIAVFDKNGFYEKTENVEKDDLIFKKTAFKGFELNQYYDLQFELNYKVKSALVIGFTESYLVYQNENKVYQIKFREIISHQKLN